MEGFWIWIVIMIIVGISKMIEKAKQAASENSPDRPRPRSTQRPRPTPSQPRRVSQPPPVVRPPLLDEEEEPIAPPVRPHHREWAVDEDELRRFLGEVTGTEPEPVRPPTPPPTPVMPAAPRAAEPAPSFKAESESSHVAASRPFEQVEERPNRAAQWAAAMRDPANLRNSIIAAEILGPPRALRNE
jgi:cytoskeletal protein RodZ